LAAESRILSEDIDFDHASGLSSSIASASMRVVRILGAAPKSRMGATT
jgi:hypothetical protein